MKKFSSKWFLPLLLLISVIGIFVACSTEKNTFINRLYHGTTARYNGYFNAKELVRQGLENYRKNYRENYYEILPIELLPNEDDVVEFYPIVDTAISKCKKVISKHSMPTASKPSQKKTEHANWVDQNWIMIGKCNYIRRDYQEAFKNFEYIRKFYTDRPSTYTGQLWMAKTQIELGEITEAGRTLQKLEQRYQNAKEAEREEKENSKFSLFKKSKLSRKSDDENKAPNLPKYFDFEMAKTKARLALEKDNQEEAIKQLKIALKEARDKEDKARLNFIIGQLLQENNNSSARKYYTQAIKKNAPFEMSFHARINRAVVSNLDNDQMIKELKGMADEQRYMEFRDQIYYAMARVELGRNDISQAKSYLSKSVFYSLDNPRQKGVSYEKLGDLSFNEKNYVFAQKYYDSSAQVIPETYVNAEIIKNKADNLAKLVDNIDLIAFEDSVQKIANMDEKTREKFLKDVIKQLKKEEELRKQREAEKAQRMRELQQSYAQQNAGRGNKWYFSNPKAMQEGLEEFRTVWGQRENEDNWRYSNIPAELTFDEEEFNDSIPEDTLAVENNEISLEELRPEDLMGEIPLTDSAMQASNERLLEALYSSGMIYKEQLNETELGARQFQRVLNHDIENKHNVLSAFQLYKIYENANSSKANTNKQYILNNYPNSDYANYLRDPEYFIKKKERDALALKEYLRSVDRYERGLFYPIIVKADDVLSSEPNNIFRKEYYLLKAMAMGQINADKTSLIPVLEKAIEEYPDTEVAARAQEMINLINEGVPPFKPFDFTSTDMFDYSAKDKYLVLVYLTGDVNQNKALQDISNFNREFFSRKRLNATAKIYDSSLTFVQTSEFESEQEAKDYIRDFKKTKKHLGDLRNNEIIFISPKNFKTLMKEKVIEEYEKFYNNNY